MSGSISQRLNNRPPASQILVNASATSPTNNTSSGFSFSNAFASPLSSVRSTSFARAGASSLGSGPESSVNAGPAAGATQNSAMVAAAVAAAKHAMSAAGFVPAASTGPALFSPSARPGPSPPAPAASTGLASIKGSTQNSLNSIMAADLNSLSSGPSIKSPTSIGSRLTAASKPPSFPRLTAALGSAPHQHVTNITSAPASHQSPSPPPAFPSSGSSSVPTLSRTPSVGSDSGLDSARNVVPEILGPYSREQFTSVVLMCGNCDNHDEKVRFWCSDCQSNPPHQHGPSASGAGNVPELFVLCEQCNEGLHKPARMQSHKRIPFRYFSSPARSAVEANIKEKSFPSALPGTTAVHQLICSNCENNPVHNYCGDCQLLLCRACTRDLHAPKSKKLHIRYQTPYRFVSGIANVGSMINLPVPSYVGGAAALTAGASSAAPSSSVPARSPVSASPPSVTRSLPGVSTTMTVPPVSIPVNSPASLLSRLNSTKKSNLPTPPSNSATRFVTEFEAAEAKYNSASAGKVKPVSYAVNSAVAGDILHVHEIALEGELQAEMLQCRNTFNAFDFIGNVQIVQIAVGQSHCSAVTAAGSLFMWGSNQDHQLGFDCGDSRECSQPTIVQIPGDKRVRMVACGYDHTICCTTDNNVYTWGAGLMGRLGHNSDANCEKPTLINWKMHTKATLDPKEEIFYVAAGQHNSGVIVRGRKDRKQLYMWGGNNSGILGTGDRMPRFVPTLVKIDSGRGTEGSAERLPEVISLAFGGLHSVCVTAAGDVYTTGANTFGQLGYTLAESNTPVSKSATVSKFQAETGDSGDGGDSQLTYRLVLKLKQAGVRAVHACTGELMTSVLTSQGEIYSWGSGETHQLGIMDNVDQFAPVKAAVLGGENPELRAISLAVGTSACCAVTETGDVYAWGYSVETPTPALVSNLRSNCIQRVALGALNNLVCLTGLANEVFEWRFTDEGDDAASQEPVLNRQLRGKRLQSIACGKSHYSMATQAGKLIVLGSNVDNQLGLEVESSVEGEEIVRPIEVTTPFLIKEVKCAAEHSVALTTEGKVLCWGMGGMGRLGHGNDGDQRVPKLVKGLEKFECIAIAIGPHNTGAVTKDHQAYVWGSGHAGQLGNNSLMPVLAPIPLKLEGEKVLSLAFGNRHTALITVDGKLYTFGENAFGQLALSTRQGGKSAENAKYPTPQRVDAMAKHKCIALACGDNNTFVLTDQGEVYAFGQGETNQLCTPGGDDTFIPVKIPFPFDGEASGPAGSDAPKSTKIVQLAVSAINCVAVSDNGSVYVWGFQLGEKPTRIDTLVKQKKKIEKCSIGPSSLMLAT